MWRGTPKYSAAWSITPMPKDKVLIDAGGSPLKQKLCVGSLQSPSSVFTAKAVCGITAVSQLCIHSKSYVRRHCSLPILCSQQKRWVASLQSPSNSCVWRHCSLPALCSQQKLCVASLQSPSSVFTAKAVCGISAVSQLCVHSKSCV